MRGADEACVVLEIPNDVAFQCRCMCKKEFTKLKISTVFCIQDCNMAGSYYRNFYYDGATLYGFTSRTTLFDDLPYERTTLSEFQWILNREDQTSATP